MSYSTKNYTEQGGDVTHIGGKLIIEEGAQVEPLKLRLTKAESYMFLPLRKLHTKRTVQPKKPPTL